MPRYARNPSPPIWISILILAISIGIIFWSYSCTRSSCEDRGGHIEIVYGGRGGWVCDGASR